MKPGITDLAMLLIFSLNMSHLCCLFTCLDYCWPEQADQFVCKFSLFESVISELYFAYFRKMKYAVTTISCCFLKDNYFSSPKILHDYNPQWSTSQNAQDNLRWSLDDTYTVKPFEKPLRREATPSSETTWPSKSKHQSIDFYPWRGTTILERPTFWWKRGSHSI